MARPRIDAADGRAALDRALTAEAVRADTALAVRYTLQVLAEHAPGHAVEVRVPPFGAAQCVEGPRHTRGTPPAVVEMDPGTWLGLVVGRLPWAAGVAAGAIRASGTRSDLSELIGELAI